MPVLTPTHFLLSGQLPNNLPHARIPPKRTYVGCQPYDTKDRDYPTVYFQDSIKNHRAILEGLAQWPPANPAKWSIIGRIKVINQGPAYENGTSGLPCLSLPHRLFSASDATAATV